MLKFSQKPIRPEKHLTHLIEFFKAQEDVAALYVFGSRASGTAGPLSDIDIAILLRDGFERDVYREKEVFYWGKTNEILHTDEVGFVLLNIAPLSIQFGVITDAKVLYSRDEDARLCFEEKITDLYLDFKHILDKYDIEFAHQVKNGTAFG